MKPDEKKVLATQLVGNPLWHAMHDDLAQDCVDRMVGAKNEDERIYAQAYARAARDFRRDCERWLDNTPARKTP